MQFLLFIQNKCKFLTYQVCQYFPKTINDNDNDDDDDDDDDDNNNNQQ
jgi:hypothetical protein